ncbi:flagellar export chaperone FliS [Variovorax sp. J22R115]|uniref:flagellar export chaperone FliS n=1 Tax=Variovorax sp. J22R115 TaxID=3053509 RepID=UPI002577DB86|nr:flagellar export chaperone FliS [Variovorax sp. J22R115]MDM0052393.1 flagellar export chaperone FliS [Variovorax sp. J22R115]
MYTPHTFRTGAGAYARVGVETSAMSASPHQLICMLFDGAKTSIGMARHHMAAGEIVPKGNAISKTIGIVDSGLKASLDAKAAGPAGEELVSNLTALYDYIIQRLLFANLRNDAQALDEADGLLDNIASAWREIDASAPRA